MNANQNKPFALINILLNKTIIEEVKTNQFFILWFDQKAFDTTQHSVYASMTLTWSSGCYNVNMLVIAEKGKITNANSITIYGVTIQPIREGESYKYLGQDENLGQWRRYGRVNFRATTNI